MPTSIIYYLASSPSDSSPTQDLIQRLHNTYEALPLSNWTLSHRLFRDIPAGDSSDAIKTSGHRYLQILTLSHHAPHTHVGITKTHPSPATGIGTSTTSPKDAAIHSVGSEPATIIAIPAGPLSDEFNNLMLSKLGPLWQQRQALHVSGGSSYEVGAFRIRIGELKQGLVGKGALCEIESLDEEDWLSAEAILKAFWEGFGLQGGREVYRVPGLDEGQSSVRQWLEIMRLRL